MMKKNWNQVLYNSTVVQKVF